jgi:hypothetical protein
MNATAFLGFAVLVVIGITFLALLLEFLDPERPARREARKRIPEGIPVAGPGPALVAAFFAKPHERGMLPASAGFDEDLFAFLQHHVKTEQALVAEFVHLPSIDSLYRQARPPLTMH